MKTFITLEFGYSPLVLMCQSRKLKSRTNERQKRALRLVYKNHTSLNELLVKDNLKIIYSSNIYRMYTLLAKRIDTFWSGSIKTFCP